jgi:DNA-binding response OmpR family regulator
LPFSSVEGVYDLLDSGKVDLLIVDRNLPKVEGSYFVKELRGYGYKEPVIFLTAKDKQSDIIDGFESGADDYITKPFDIKELQLRVKALLSRVKKSGELIKYKDIVYYVEDKRFLIDNKEINLTPLEHRLMQEFLNNRGRLLSRDYLLEEVWGSGYDKQYKTVTVAIKRLKDKIDSKNSKNYIKAVRAQGYIFE